MAEEQHDSTIQSDTLALCGKSTDETRSETEKAEIEKSISDEQIKNADVNSIAQYLQDLVNAATKNLITISDGDTSPHQSYTDTGSTEIIKSEGIPNGSATDKPDSASGETDNNANTDTTKTKKSKPKRDRKRKLVVKFPFEKYWKQCARDKSNNETDEQNVPIVLAEELETFEATADVKSLSKATVCADGPATIDLTI